LHGEGNINLFCHNVTFKGSGIITGNITYNDLNFTAGKSYILQSGKTQTIIDHWRIQGTCVSYIMLQSSTNGSFATVTKATGSVIGFNLHIRDIHCVGGASFEAYNSVDLGGNTGWNFSTLPALSNPLGINGTTNLCVGQSGVIYYIPNVTGAISYTWTVPIGVTITQGQGDSLITISTTGGASGNITVAAFNGCGFSAPSVLSLINCTLPIEYLTFAANRIGDKVQLDWSTISETNNKFFSIERSKDCKSFEKIGEIEGAGNSNITLNYLFYDDSPIKEVSYYRIKQVDFDGKFTYSETKSVRFENESIILVYPNPAQNSITIECNKSSSNKYQLELRNPEGQEVLSRSIDFVGTFKIDLSNFADGLYFLTLKNEVEQIQRKLLIQR
jgi:hypothetical protein